MGQLCLFHKVPCFLLDNAEAQVERLFCFDYFCRFELNMLAAQVFNQPRAGTE